MRLSAIHYFRGDVVYVVEAGTQVPLVKGGFAEVRDDIVIRRPNAVYVTEHGWQRIKQMTAR